MEVPRPRQWTAARHAIQAVVHRWHPEHFPALGREPAECDPDIVEIYDVIDRWIDPDILAAHLLGIERRTLGLPESDEATRRAVVAELLAIDFDALIDRENPANETP